MNTGNHMAVFTGTGIQRDDKQTTIQQMKAFYLSRGIQLPADYDGEDNPAPPVSAVPLHPLADTLVQVQDDAVNEIMDNVSDFKEFYKNFYEQFKKGKDVATIAAEIEVQSEVNEVEEEIVENPYGEWVEVNMEEEAARNMPVTLVQDDFTESDPYHNTRRAEQRLYDSDDEEQDKDINILENKDSSAQTLFGDSSDEDISKPVVFKKRKRKADKKGGIRKRPTLSQISDE